MKWRRMGGFTLLETLVALVLMSLLMVALFGGFRAGIASWRVADSHIEHTEPQLLLNRMLYRHLSQVQLSTGGAFWGEQASNLGFIAQNRLLRYVAPLALAVDNQLYCIELASDPDGRRGVWIKYVPYDAKQGQQAALDAMDYLLVSNELSMQFSYFVDEAWHDALEEGVIPTLVRVRWFSDERVWSDSIFRVTGA